ncbi:MAG: hypothetical protein IJ309_01965 [Clostridia bacterium]|nr:hypothetical protein [Clostridia bacterium]
MIIQNVITAICLLALFAELIFVITSVIIKKRADRIAFLRTFKKGKCAIIYVIAIPLYFIGILYAEAEAITGNTILNTFFASVHEIINLVVLKYDVSPIASLMEASPFYAFTIYFTFVMVGLNAILFTLSFTSQQIWSFFGWLKRRFTFNERLFIFGDNEKNETIYESDKTRTKVIIDDLDEKACERLYQNKIYYSLIKDEEDSVRWIVGSIKRYSRRHIVVINTGDEERNMRLCRLFTEIIEQSPEALQDRLFDGLRIFVYGDPKYETLYADIVATAHGCLSYVNKYQEIAIDFIDNYPLTRFMDERHIDYEKATIKENVNINVLFIGFGKTNQQIFLTSVANNQFLTEKDDKIVSKPVNYYMLDKDKAENNKNLNHNYYRFVNEVDISQRELYLPFPELPANEEYISIDTNDQSFYQKIKSVTSRSRNDVNFIIIGFGSDLENIDMAQKLLEKKQEWGISNLTIFVKARTHKKSDTLLEQDSCYFIGHEASIVYNIDKLLGDDLFKMSQLRNQVYDLEYKITSRGATLSEAEIADSAKESHKKWYKNKTQMERDSSIYCCLSLRSKLNLIGYDYVKASDPREAVSEKEFLSTYALGDPICYDKYSGVLADGKRIISYDIDFKESLRKTLAIHEHQRWNAFMISRGIIPSTIDQILNETTVVDGKTKYTNGRVYGERRHGNLTTFEGLVTFRQLVAKRDGATEADKDVIKYDYQLLDDAYWLLNKTGYKIIKIS